MISVSIVRVFFTDASRDGNCWQNVARVQFLAIDSIIIPPQCSHQFSVCQSLCSTIRVFGLAVSYFPVVIIARKRFCWRSDRNKSVVCLGPAYNLLPRWRFSFLQKRPTAPFFITLLFLQCLLTTRPPLKRLIRLTTDRPYATIIWLHGRFPSCACSSRSLVADVRFRADLSAVHIQVPNLMRF
jgi:hypothetical protein